MSIDMRLMTHDQALAWFDRELRALANERHQAGFSQLEWQDRADILDEILCDYMDAREQLKDTGYLEWEEDN